MSTSIMNEIVPKFRRAIGDSEKPYAYSDIILTEYMADSIEGILLFYKHNYIVDRETMEVTPEVEIKDQFLFILNAHIDMLENRSNINFSVGGLSIRRQSTLDSKDSLKAKLEKAIRQQKLIGNIGKSSTEYDTFKSRYDDWLKYLNY